MSKLITMLAIVAALPLAAWGTIHQISIIDFAFSPASLAIHTGDTVNWTNNATDRPHTATAANGSWDSGFLQPGQSYMHSFPNAGTVNYLCTLHGFTGVLTVSQVMGIDAPQVNLTSAPALRLLGNPVKDRAIVEVSGGDPKAKLEVFNLAGALVALVEPGSGLESRIRYEWDTRMTAEGLYLVRVRQADRNLEHTVLVEK